MSEIITVRIQTHARERMTVRGATNSEVKDVVKSGEQFEAKFGRAGFRRNFPFNRSWRGTRYKTKQVEVYAVPHGKGWLVISVITRYF